jgi:hypothetical protein
VDRWISGLVSHLLKLTHGMWVHQNGINHAIDEQGLLICLTVDIKATIHEEFQCMHVCMHACKGTDGLARCNFHFIRCGWDNVKSLIVHRVGSGEFN